MPESNQPTQQNVTVNVHQPPPRNPNVIMNMKQQGPSMLVRFIWFLFIGWWLSGFAILFGWLFTVLIITLPLGLYIINRLPQITTLRASSQTVQTRIDEHGNTVVETVDIPQRPFIWRMIYFLLVGWWFSAIWLVLAWLISLVSTIIFILIPLGWPLVFFMYSKAAAITTLRRT